MPLLALFAVIALAGLMAPSSALPADPPPAAGASQSRPGLFHEDPEHLWNRLHRHFTVRTSASGEEHGFDALDPLLWPDTEYLLTGQSHLKALRLLDEFIRGRGEEMISDPLKRALLQRDLWAVFDWTAMSWRNKYAAARVALRARLAKVLWGLALSEEQIQALPDNYGQAVASEKYASEYDPEQPEKPFLPPDLFNPRGPWAVVHSAGPAAPAHLTAFSGRSVFLVLLRLPGGREATLEYLEKLWTFPNPWPTQRGGDPPFGRGFPLPLNPAIPQFPAGTKVALARRLVLFDADGKLIPTALTESVQIRVYREIPADLIQSMLRGQDFFELELSRALLLAGEAGGLHPLTEDERRFRIFGGHGVDVFESNRPIRPLKCVNCHATPGIHSVQSVRSLLRPQPLISDSATDNPKSGPLQWQASATLNWKGNRYDWGLLNALRPRPTD